MGRFLSVPTKIETLRNVGIPSRDAKAIASGDTGEVKFGFWDITLDPPEGWLWLNGDTIGNASSGATHAENTLEALFTHLWTVMSDTYAPVSSGRGATALADFQAGKTLTLPNSAGKMPICKASSGTASNLGEVGGALTHTHNTKAHYHGMGSGADLVLKYRNGIGSTLGISEGAILTNSNNLASTESAVFGGRIGLVTGGVDGNSAQATTDNSATAPFIVYVARVAR